MTARVPAPMTDSAALRRYARSGDPEAFDVLVRRYHAMVLATCRRSLGADGRVAPEDAAQEVFLKLARSAGRIRSSVAAWLHACALGTAVDLVRRADARRRAEAAAARELDRVGTPRRADESTELWLELEPMIDRALSELDPSDRELIVARYLAGRSQAELAREARVSEGTVSRRLRKALARLRSRLADHGLALAGVGLLGSALGHAAADTLATGAQTFAPMLGKVALTGAAGPRPPILPIGLSTKLVIGAGVAATLVGVVAAPALLSGASTGTTSASVVQPVELGPERPRRTIGPFQVITAADRSFDERGVWITDDRIAMRHGYNLEGEARRATMDILRTTPVKDDPDTGDVSERAVFEARVVSVTPPDDEWHRFKLGQRLTLSVGFDTFGRITITDTTKTVQLGKNEPRWSGVRPPPGWREFGQVPDDAGSLGIRGPWTESERIPMTIDSREIYFGGSNWVANRYRIIEWDRVRGHTRVLSINAGGRDPRKIGTRFPLLFREDEIGYTIAFFPVESPRAGDFPSSFEFSATNPVRVVSVGKGP